MNAGDQEPGPRFGARENTLLIHEAIREDILSGQLAPASWISQVQVAKRFGVSRGPVREALRLLEREGLIEATVNQRARVTAISVADLEQLYAARIVHEGLGIAATVPALTDADLHALEALIEEMDSLAGANLLGWEAAHRRFHFELVKHAGRRLTRMLDQFYDHSERYRRIYITGDPRAWSVGAAEHRQIVDACASRDASAAATLLGRHLSRTALSGLALMTPEHDPVLVRAAIRQLLTSADSGVDTLNV